MEKLILRESGAGEDTPVGEQFRPNFRGTLGLAKKKERMKLDTMYRQKGYT